MFSSVQSLIRVWLFATPRTAALQASLSITNSWSLLKLMSIKSVTPSNNLIFCHPFLLPPSIFPSIRVFSNESALHIRGPKYWNFSISPSNEYSGLVSLGLTDLISLLSKGLSRVFFSTIVWKYQFFDAQPSLCHLYMTTGKTIVLTIQTFASKVMSLLFNMPSRLVIAFLPRSKSLLTLWLQSLCAVILEPKKIKYITVSTFPPFAMEWWDWMPWS